LLSLFILLLNAPLLAESDRANLTGTVSYFGIAYPFSLYIKPREKWTELPEAVFERNFLDIENAAIPDFLAEAFTKCGVDGNDFASVLFIVSFVNAIEFEEDTIIRSLSQIVRYKRTNQPSRALLAAALCQSMGYDAIGVSDERDNYYLSVSFCKDERIDSIATNASFGYEGRVYYLLDPSLRYPVGMLPREPGSSFKIIGERKDVSCILMFSDSLKIPELPADSRKDREIAFFKNYRNVNYDIAFHLKANLRDYVSNYPLSVPLFFSFVKEEIGATGCVKHLCAYLKEFNGEQDKVNYLLGIVQDSLLCVYLEGPMGPTTIALFEQQADCDTRSQILAGILLNAGFERILVMRTEKHLALALAPEDEKTIIPGGTFILHKEREYYFLDAAIKNGKWGTAIESGQWQILLDLEEVY
jgi:hypothetical protein